MAKTKSNVQIGDVVELRSGGPSMTVVGLDKGDVETVWFAGADTRGGSFPQNALRVTTPFPSATKP